MVKNPPINAGDMGLIPDLERSYMAQELRENPSAWEPQLWSPRAASAHTLEPTLHSKRSHRNGKPARCNEDPAQPKINTAAAKSLQSCPTLCDPINGSPPGPAIPGILQARTLEWVAISSSNA